MQARQQSLFTKLSAVVLSSLTQERQCGLSVCVCVSRITPVCSYRMCQCFFYLLGRYLSSSDIFFTFQKIFSSLHTEPSVFQPLCEKTSSRPFLSCRVFILRLSDGDTVQPQGGTAEQRAQQRG